MTGLAVGNVSEEVAKIDVANCLVLPVVVGWQVGVTTPKASDDTSRTCFGEMLQRQGDECGP